MWHSKGISFGHNPPDFQNLLYKAVIQHPDGLGEVPVVYAEDDVQLVRALVDHTDIDAGFSQRREDLAGNAGAESHLPANGGYHGDLVVHVEGIGAASFWISASTV